LIWLGDIGINGNQKTRAQIQEQRITALRGSFRRVFPAEPFTGKVARDGDGPNLSKGNALVDDDQALYQAPNGRRWTEVPPQLLYNQPDGLPLLTNDAIVAFLPTWLVGWLEDIEGENEVRNFVLSSLNAETRLL
jgi:hypothetical protein